MNLLELYDKYLIIPLEKEIKILKSKNVDKKIIFKLDNLLLKYYKLYYEKSYEFIK